ncbi:peptide ligase PGM1-related protein [Streptomyces lavendulocolor]|uniref:preATP grasp domain-containing protein n=1 Tax=Streptomyces lavendulocolor TaxID=67316 RepID=UPI0033EBDADB
MTRLVIGNWANETGPADMPPAQRRHVGSQGQRMLWLSRPGDVVVLPLAPDEDFLAYVTGKLGFSASDLTVVVPPEGKLGGDVLTGDRLMDEGFLTGLRGLLRERGIRAAEPYYLDGYVNRFVRALGLAEGTTGFAFMDQGGNELLNGKVAFRAVASGIGLPLPHGMVSGTPETVVDFVWDLLTSGRAAIVKQDVNAGGFGNEIITPDSGVEALGALHRHVFTDRGALADHVAGRWDWYTAGSGGRVVVEHYVDGALPVWGEAVVAEESVDVYGYGRIRMKPVCDGVVIPVPGSSDHAKALPAFLRDLERLAEAMRAMGYRGVTNIDAMLTADGRVLFNEWNGRYGGSSHLFAIGRRVVGGDFLRDRCLIERRETAFPSFGTALRTLEEHGLAYDPETRTGVLIPVYGTGPDGLGGEAAVVGRDAGEAEELERAMVGLFGD